jgi:hypothetical protein
MKAYVKRGENDAADAEALELWGFAARREGRSSRAFSDGGRPMLVPGAYFSDEATGEGE